MVRKGPAPKKKAPKRTYGPIHKRKAPKRYWSPWAILQADHEDQMRRYRNRQARIAYNAARRRVGQGIFERTVFKPTWSHAESMDPHATQGAAVTPGPQPSRGSNGVDPNRTGLRGGGAGGKFSLGDASKIDIFGGHIPKGGTVPVKEGYHWTNYGRSGPGIESGYYWKKNDPKESFYHVMHNKKVWGNIATGVAGTLATELTFGAAAALKFLPNKGRILNALGAYFNKNTGRIIGKAGRAQLAARLAQQRPANWATRGLRYKPRPEYGSDIFAPTIMPKGTHASEILNPSSLVSYPKGFGPMSRFETGVARSGQLGVDPTVRTVGKMGRPRGFDVSPMKGGHTPFLRPKFRADYRPPGQFGRPKLSKGPR